MEITCDIVGKPCQHVRHSTRHPRSAPAVPTALTATRPRPSRGNRERAGTLRFRPAPNAQGWPSVVHDHRIAHVGPVIDELGGVDGHIHAAVGAAIAAPPEG